MEVDRVKIATRYVEESHKENPSTEVLTILRDAMFDNMDREKKVRHTIPTVSISEKDYTKCFND